MLSNISSHSANKHGKEIASLELLWTQHSLQLLEKIVAVYHSRICETSDYLREEKKKKKNINLNVQHSRRNLRFLLCRH